jgi:hypothetical protein
VFEEYHVVVSTQTMSRELRAMGYRKLTARPKHHAQAATAIEGFKKTYGPPRSQGALARLAADPVCFNVSGLGGSFSRPRWRYARSGPHKTHGVERRFLKSGFRTAVRL